MKSIALRRPKGFRVISFGILTVVFAVFLAACDPLETKPAATSPATGQTPVASASPVASPSASPSGSPSADANPSTKVVSMAGRWNGPEGAYLTVTKKGLGYAVEIKDLDRTETFDGTVKGDTIEFTRKGKTETIRSATGVETGIKGFEKETNCLVITKGSEGYCRKQQP